MQNVSDQSFLCIVVVDAWIELLFRFIKISICNREYICRYPFGNPQSAVNQSIVANVSYIHINCKWFKSPKIKHPFVVYSTYYY